MHTFSSQFKLSTGFLADAACLSHRKIFWFIFPFQILLSLSSPAWVYFSCLKSNDFFKTNLHDFYKWLLLFHTHCLNPSSSVLYFFYFDYGFSPFDCGGSGGNLFFSYHFYFILFFGMEIWNGKQISMVNLLNYFSPLFLNFCAFASLLSCIDFVIIYQQLF